MVNKLIYLVVLLLLFIPLYPKFPLLGVEGTFVAIRLEDILIAMTLAILAVVAFRHKFVELFHPQGRAIWLYWLAGFVSVFSAIFLTKTASINLGLLHWARRIEYMSMFFIGFSFLTSIKQLGFVVRTFLLVALLVGVYGLGQQFLGWPVISTTNSEFAKGLALSLGEGARINSTFAGHYDLAAYSIFPLLLILGLLMTRSKHWLLLLVIGVIVYWAMLLSASRVTFAAFFATSGLFVWIMKKRWWLIPLAVVAIVSILVSPQLLGRYQELVRNHLFSWVLPVRAAVDEEIPDALKPVAEDRSLNIRLKSEWPRALRAFYKNPLLGTGYSSIGLASDNDYLRSLAEVGFLGTIAFGGVLWRIFKTSWSVMRKPKFELGHIFIIATTCGLIGLLINAVFIDVFEASKVAILAWLLLGLSEKTKTLV